MDYTTAIAELLARHGFRQCRMTRTQVGHLKVAGELQGRPIDIVVDTGASKTFVELGYCRSEGIVVSDTGQRGAPAAGAATGEASNVFVVNGAGLSLEGFPIRTEALYAIDMTHTNEKLMNRGVDPIRAVIGQDALRNHQAFIDCAALTLFLKAE